jgi:hypothetical protein
MRLNELTNNTISKNDLEDTDFDGLSKEGKQKLPIQIDNFDILFSNKGQTFVSVWDGDKMIAQLQLNKLILKKLGITVYEILDATVRPSYQGKAIGLKLYHGLVNIGITLGSFGSHSEGAKKLWARLGKNSDVSIWGINNTQVLKVESDGANLVVSNTKKLVYDAMCLNLVMTKNGSLVDTTLAGQVASTFNID